MASELFKKVETEEISDYYRNKNIDKEKLKNSSTLYIGNLSYNTTEIQLYEIFSFCGKIKRVIMGLNRITKSPCGFAFIEYFDKESAIIAKKTLMGTIIDGKEIRCDIDLGFEEDRQYGRGRTGCQRRDEMKKSYDPDRPWRKNNNNYNRQNDYRNRNGGAGRYRNNKYSSDKRYYNRNKSRSRSRSKSNR